MGSLARRLAIGAATLLLIGTATACGHDDTKSTTTNPSTTSTKAPAVALGSEVKTPLGTSALLGFQRPFGSAAQAPAVPGQEWLGLRVEACAGAHARQVGAFEWSAHGPTGERYPGAFHHGGWPFGQFPDTTLEPGTCADGWVVIAVLADAEITSVRLTDPDGIPQASWDISGGTA